MTATLLKQVSVRGATPTKASKARALPKFWVTVNPISTKGANYVHHSTMGLVWLKFAVVPLSVVLKPILLDLKQRSYTNILGPYLKLYNYDIIHRGLKLV